MITTRLIVLIALLVVVSYAQQMSILDSKVLHPRYVLDWGSETQRFGASVYTIGDINGDGVVDIAVGTPYYSTDMYPQQGNVIVLLLNKDGSVLETFDIARSVDIPRADIPAMFGSDVTLYGTNQLVIAAAGSGDIYFVTLDGTSVSSWSVISYTSFVNVPVGKFSPALCTLPDLDNDGVQELLVGTNRRIFPQYGLSFNNFFFVLFLNEDGDIKRTERLETTHDEIMQFGFTVKYLGSLSGSKDFADVAISTPRYNNGRGIIDIYRISTTGDFSVELQNQIEPDDIPLPGIRDNANFGSSFSNVGDLNGDGITDLVVEVFGKPFALYLTIDGSVSSYDQLQSSKLCDYCYSFGALGNIAGNDTIAILAGGNSGYGNEVVWILFLGVETWKFTAGLITAIAMMGFFSLLSLVVCGLMCVDNVYI